MGDPCWNWSDVHDVDDKSAGDVLRSLDGNNGPHMIPELVDLARFQRTQAEGSRPVAGGMPFRVSKLGMCLREQYLLAKGVKPREYDLRTLGVFEAGHRAAARLADELRGLGVLVAEEYQMVVERERGLHRRRSSVGSEESSDGR